MSNPIKFSTTTEPRSLKSGDFYIGTGDVDKGPTNITGFYNGITPPTGGYTIYINKISNGPAIYVCNSDSELIQITNTMFNQTFNTVEQCFQYYNTQNDKVVLNKDYEGIVTDGLVLNLDAGFIPSYPRTGTTWKDLSGNGNNGTLTNGPTFDSGNLGSIQFDGADDCVLTNVGSELNFFLCDSNNSFTVVSWFKPSGINGIICGSAIGLGTATTFVQYMTSTTFAIRVRGIFTDNTVQTNLNTSIFHMGAFTWNGTVGLGYYNNKSPVTIGIGTASNQNKNFGIADSNEGNLTNYPRFNGNVSNVQIYNRALTEQEILQNYNTIKGRFNL
jgi:hypothetical protein